MPRVSRKNVYSAYIATGSCVITFTASISFAQCLSHPRDLALFLEAVVEYVCKLSVAQRGERRRDTLVPGVAIATTLIF